MSGGAGKGATSQKTTSAAADKLANLASTFAGETSGIRKGLIGNMQEVLSTGGSTLPIISAAVERSRQAASNAMTKTEEELAQQGNADNPFGAMVKAKTRQEGELATAQTEQSLAQGIFNMISNFVLGQSQTALSGLAGAIPGMNTQKGTETAAGVGFGK